MDIKIEQEEIERVISEVITLFLIPKFRELGMPATGEWEENIHARGNEIWGRAYTEYLVNGRPPNTNQDPDAKRRWAYGMANSNPEFKAWLNARGLQEYGVQIAYKIADVGTSWYPNGSDLLEVLESQEVVNYISEQIRGIVILQITTQFQREFA